MVVKGFILVFFFISALTVDVFFARSSLICSSGGLLTKKNIKGPVAGAECKSASCPAYMQKCLACH